MTKKRQQKYRDALNEIEEIIAEIENEAIDVDVLAEKVKRATELIKFCKEKLSNTEREVNKVLEEFEEESKSEVKQNPGNEGLF